MTANDIFQRPLHIPVGLLDVPQASQQKTFHLDLQSGHLLVFGAPASGKTLLIQTILLSLGLLLSPSQAWCYVINASGQGLLAFNDLPHVGGVVSVRDVEKVRRVLSMIQRELEVRESPQEYSSDRASDAIQQSKWPHIILVIDKFASFQTEYKDTELLDLLIELAARGLSYGIHIILTADRLLDVPYRLQGLFEHRWSLRLTDEGDSVSITGRKDAARIPIDVPGRGYILDAEHGWLEFQIALPYIDTDKPNPRETLDDKQKRIAGEVENLLNAEIAARTRDVIGTAREYWPIDAETRLNEPPKVEPLAGIIPFNTFWEKMPPPPSRSNPNQYTIEAFFGIESHSLGTAGFVLSATNPTILVGGGPRSGKTTALRTIVQSIALRYTPDNVEFILIDPRRTSFRDLPIFPHQYFHVQTEDKIAEIAQHIESRLETDDITRKPIVICIDDYDTGCNQMSSQFVIPFGSPPMKGTLVAAIDKVLNLGRERGLFIVVATKAPYITSRSILAQISEMRQGLILQPHNFPSTSELLGVHLPIPLGGRQEIKGRGLMVENSTQSVVQVANDIG